MATNDGDNNIKMFILALCGGCVVGVFVALCGFWLGRKCSTIKESGANRNMESNDGRLHQQRSQHNQHGRAPPNSDLSDGQLSEQRDEDYVSLPMSDSPGMKSDHQQSQRRTKSESTGTQVYSM